jgi:SAM-dependent methyltransferase
VRITPFGGVLVVHDPPGLEAPSTDTVSGPSSGARTLASLTPRRPVLTALNVATGCGLHALLAAGHADRVVATDVNPRALEYTRLSALLSGIHNVECREGSLFDPVQGERFDLVVSNPPVAIAPEEASTDREDVLERDEISRVVVAAAAAALAPDGVAQLLVSWIHEPFESWAAPLESWLEGVDCDALLLHHVTESPLEYAARRNRHLRGDPDAHGRGLDRWTQHFDQAGITSLATGAVTLRQTTRNPPLVVHHEMASDPRGRAGEHALRLLDAAAWLAGLSDEELLATPLRIADDHSLVSERVHAGGEYGEDTISVSLGDNVGLGDTVGPAATVVLMGVEGGRIPADAIPGLAAAVDAVPTDPQELVADMTRALVARGVLVRAD